MLAINWNKLAKEHTDKLREIQRQYEEGLIEINEKRKERAKVLSNLHKLLKP